MKNKKNIRPPSKTERDENKEIKRLKSDYLSARSKFYRASSEQQAKRSYDNLVNYVSNDLNVNKENLKKAYEDKPEELKSKFNSITKYENTAVDRLARITPALFIFSCLSGLIATSTDPESSLLFATFSTIFGLGSAISAGAGFNALKNKKKAKEEIVSKSLEFSDHKRLPPPKQ